MTDDVVHRMRARADAIAESDAAVIESGGRPNARWYAAETALREGVDEIERLRAENESWQLLATIRLNEIEQLRAEAARADELQARIDEFAAATTRLRRAAVDADEWFYELAPYDDATDALLAAATKEDDRG